MTSPKKLKITYTKEAVTAILNAYDIALLPQMLPAIEQAFDAAGGWGKPFRLHLENYGQFFSVCGGVQSTQAVFENELIGYLLEKKRVRQ